MCRMRRKGKEMGLRESMRRVLLAGVGAVATGIETAAVLVDKFVEKGESTVEQGKAVTRDFSEKAKQKKDVFVEEQLTEEQRAKLRKALDDVDVFAKKAADATKEALDILTKETKKAADTVVRETKKAADTVGEEIKRARGEAAEDLAEAAEEIGEALNPQGEEAKSEEDLCCVADEALEDEDAAPCCEPEAEKAEEACCCEPEAEKAEEACCCEPEAEKTEEACCCEAEAEKAE